MKAKCSSAHNRKFKLCDWVASIQIVLIFVAVAISTLEVYGYLILISSFSSCLHYYFLHSESVSCILKVDHVTIAKDLFNNLHVCVLKRRSLWYIFHTTALRMRSISLANGPRMNKNH